MEEKRETITIEGLEELLKSEKSVKFSFLKKDGTERIANATRDFKILEENSAVPNGNGKENTNTVCFFDMDKKAWRSVSISLNPTVELISVEKSIK